jgi:hypothetical protein
MLFKEVIADYKNYKFKMHIFWLDNSLHVVSTELWSLNM